MNSLVVFSLIVAFATAHPLEQIVLVSQDNLGSYDLKFAVDGISRTEHRDVLGNVVGGFVYTDPHGIQRKTEFTSGVQGFNPVSADIPVPVVDTPEVALAKTQHMDVLRAESSRPLIEEFQDKGLVPLLKSNKFLTIPILKTDLHGVTFVDLNNLLKSHVIAVPVVENGFIADTPEVTLAKIEHFAAHATAKANLLKH